MSDWVDGWLARRFDTVTRLGQLLDPVADRLYVVVALVCLAVVGTLPWWLVAAVLARDVLLVGNLLMLRAAGVGSLPVHVVGKAATFALLAGVPLVLLAEQPDVRTIVAPLAWAFLLWGVGLYWWAGVGYVVHARRVLRTRFPGTGAKPSVDVSRG